MAIHKTAIVDKSAKLAKDLEVGPYTVIGPEVEIDSGTWVGSHVVIKGPTKIGKNNKIYQFASVGEDPQDKKYKGERSSLVIGDNNSIRECVTIHRGTAQDNNITTIGSHNLFMAYSHIAHDCIVGNHCVFANSSAVAGHVRVDDHVIMSGLSGIHQFVHLGKHSFISNCSIINKDVPPFVMVTGGANPTACGLNLEGLKRHGYTPDDVLWLRRAYKVIYRQGLRAEQAIEVLKQMEADNKYVKVFTEFLLSSKRGIIR